ncbi:hypothetical protein Pmar_PMAR009005 [Perkinsus marinus ATCC 50983]|uniref:Uncharacterized protein n=1 Tax=Perkinsus marinus (strain ATCC 50983 / TXsc) TaxID=423536 RepID=C5KD67_PERM5|nr:hypothetical protein Pmar_PMAR009005 [Perkinsus marinus ATCC 50983]EER17574.1 hypothetical protein Pmar_PMAR009005 [Perkinsus marinus ATCC 50983]|eukprot:XP_002785778.1 hypothetical protein Pmar_PMAR009005 [Perkinsus marinus ATCC 50983]
MFVEQFEETILYKEFRDNGKILVDRHCEVECQSDSSGTGPTHRNTVAVEPVIEKESDESQEYSQLVEAARRLSAADKIRLQEKLRRMLEDLDDRLEL